MIPQQIQMNKKQKEAFLWEPATETFESSLKEIQAEFQSQNLGSLRSNPITYQKVKIGTIYTYKCNVEACDFHARICSNSGDSTIPKVEVASNFFPYP